MTNLYLIRAAEGEGALYRVAQGWLDTDLTPQGRRQAETLRERMTALPVDAVYTSDLYRARATAAPLCRAAGLTAHVREDLRELCLGAWEGKSWGNIAYEESRQLDQFHTAPHRWYAEGAEEPEHAAARLGAALREIAGRHEGGNVAVISHGYVIRLLLAELEGTPPERAHDKPVGRNGSIAHIRAEGGALRLVSRDGTDHLPAEPPKTAPDFDADMYLHRLRWVEYGPIMADAVSCVWEESGEDRPFDRERLLSDAAMFPTTVGYVEHDPAAFLQVGMDPSWITLICVHPGCRRAGLGAQLLGQAVLTARAKGEDYLYIALPPENPYRAFFLHHGFVPADETPEGREILEKSIFLPEL